MCVILHNPNNIQFDKQELQQHYLFNPDGTGLYYYNTNTKEPTIKKWEKGTPFETIWQVLNSLHRYKQITNVNIHFRLGTSGGLTSQQIHPIGMKHNMWLMHNGVSREFEWAPTVASDTQCIAFWLDNVFYKTNVKNICLLDDQYKKILGKRFDWNKLVLLQDDKCQIINPELGEWKDGIWRSYKSYTKPYLFIKNN